MKIIIAAAIAAVSSLCMSACSLINIEVTPETSRIESETTAATLTEAATETAAEETGTDKGEPVQDVLSVDYDGIVTELLSGLDEIDRLYCTNIPVDDTDKFVDDEGLEYFRVADSKYSSVEDISYFIDSYITENLRQSRYFAILDSEKPYFIENDGKLYMQPNGKGGGMEWSDVPVVVQDAYENTFTVIKTYDDFGASAVAKITVVSVGDGWRIDTLKLNV